MEDKKVEDIDKEFDDSNIAWETYEIMYKENFSDWIIDTEKSRKNIAADFMVGNRTIKGINWGGETDFNFTKGFAHSRLESFRKSITDKYIEVDDYCDMYNNNLRICEEMTHSIANISLQAKTGNFQGVKQGIGNDRVDTFVWALDEYYNNNSNLMMNYSSFDNMESIKELLSLFDSAETYCKEIYHINESLVDALIESGKVAINTTERTIAYMNLAIRFWRQKLMFLRGYEELNTHKVLVKEIERLENCMDGLFTFN